MNKEPYHHQLQLSFFQAKEFNNTLTELLAHSLYHYVNIIIIIMHQRGRAPD